MFITVHEQFVNHYELLMKFYELGGNFCKVPHMPFTNFSGLLIMTSASSVNVNYKYKCIYPYTTCGLVKLCCSQSLAFTFRDNSIITLTTFPEVLMH